MTIQQNFKTKVFSKPQKNCPQSLPHLVEYLLVIYSKIESNQKEDFLTGTQPFSNSPADRISQKRHVSAKGEKY